MILCILKGEMPFKMHKNIFFKEKKIVGILTLISKILSTTSERLKASNLFICQYFSFYEQMRLPAQLS